MTDEEVDVVRTVIRERYGYTGSVAVAKEAIAALDAVRARQPSPSAMDTAQEIMTQHLLRPQTNQVWIVDSIAAALTRAEARGRAEGAREMLEQCIIAFSKPSSYFGTNLRNEILRILYALPPPPPDGGEG